MKRVFEIVLIMALLFMGISDTLAANSSCDMVGSVTKYRTYYMTVEYECLGDNVTGAFPSFDIDGQVIGSKLIEVDYWNTTSEISPTDNSDLDIVDSIGKDYIGTSGDNIVDGNATTQTFPYSATTSAFFEPLVTNTLTVTTTNNSVADAIIHYLFIFRTQE